MLIKPLLIATLETALNRYLALDEQVGDILQPLAGKVIAVTLQPFDETVYLCPNHDGIQLLDQYVGTPDTALTGSVFALGMMGLSATPMRAIFSGEVSISGDTQVGHQFQQLFSKLDINLEHVLAQYTGQRIANKLTNLLQSANHWTQDSITTLKLNTSELLQEETRDLPAPAEADIFYQQVDTLRHDYDRLLQRLSNLQQAIANHPDNPD